MAPEQSAIARIYRAADTIIRICTAQSLPQEVLDNAIDIRSNASDLRRYAEGAPHRSGPTSSDDVKALLREELDRAELARLRTIESAKAADRRNIGVGLVLAAATGVIGTLLGHFWK